MWAKSLDECHPRLARLVLGFTVFKSSAMGLIQLASEASSAGSSFTANSVSVRIGTEIRQSLLADHALVAGGGSALEAMLIAEVHCLRGTPGFIGAATTAKEVQDLVVSVDKRVLLFLVDSIAKDKELALLRVLADTPYPPLVAHLSNYESWASREELDHFPAHALLSSHSIGTGKVNAAWLTDTSARPVATEWVSGHWVGREP